MDSLTTSSTFHNSPFLDALQSYPCDAPLETESWSTTQISKTAIGRKQVEKHVNNVYIKIHQSNKSNNLTNRVVRVSVLPGSRNP